MKIKFFSILFFISICSSYAVEKDAFFSKKYQYKGVKKIIEKTFNQWMVISTFDNEGFLISETNSYKKEIRSEYQYKYVVNDNLLRITRVDNIGSAKENNKVEQYDYDSFGRYLKFRVYFEKSTTSSYFYDDFIYEDGLLISYTEANSWQKENGKAVRIICEYNDKKQRTCKMEIWNETDTTFYSYVYSQSGHLTDYIQENHSDDVVYSGVITWSKKKTNKIHIRYSDFDKYGNWRKSYFITSKGKVFRSERKFEYW